MKGSITLHFYSDPGHGWIKVPRLLLISLGIESKISSFSYQMGDYAYLEEDCDASTLMDALKALGVTVTFKHSTSNKSSKIRNYPRFQAGFKRVEWQEGKRITMYGKEYTMLEKGIVTNGIQRFKIKVTQLDDIRELDVQHNADR